MSMANSFSGGLFLAIALVHILPEAVDDYKEWSAGNNGGVESTFPLPYILVFAGYTFILTVDRVMFDSHSLFDHGHGGHGHGHGDEGHGHDHHHEDDNESTNEKIQNHSTFTDPRTGIQ
jgi:zinc transporter 1/2/3